MREARQGHRQAVKTSVIIATCRRPEALGRLLESLKAQLAEKGRELFIAENGSAEPCAVTLDGARIHRLHDARPGKCRVQNRCIGQASGEIVVCLDDDLVAAPDYLSQVESFFDGHPEFAAMKGRTLAARDPKAAAGESWVYLDLPIVDHGERVVEVRGVVGANMAFRKRAFDLVGLFDERLGPGAAGHEEETEMSARLRAAGLRIGYAPRALVYHEVDPARADAARFIRVARERGRCRMLHERHGAAAIVTANVIGHIRLLAARMLGAGPARLAREQKKLAIAQGMLDGLSRPSPAPLNRGTAPPVA